MNAADAVRAVDLPYHSGMTLRQALHANASYLEGKLTLWPVNEDQDNRSRAVAVAQALRQLAGACQTCCGRPH